MFFVFPALAKTPLQLALCEVMDNFNGTYRVTCPPMEGACIRVSIQLAATQFFLYQAEYFTKLMKESIYEGKFCPSKNTGQEMDFMRKPECSYSASVLERGRWILFSTEENRWAWYSDANDCLVYADEQRSWVGRCISNIKSLTVVGDSHLRNMFELFVRLAGARKELVERVEGNAHGINYIMNSAHHLHAGLSTGFVERVQVLLEEANSNSTRPLGPEDFFVMNSGAWDLDTFHLTGAIDRFPLVAKAVSSLMSHPKYRKATFIFMPTPPSRGDHSFLGFRNFASNNVLNTVAKHRMKALGVEVLEHYNVLNSRRDDSFDGGHYMPFWGKNVQGHPALVVYLMLFRRMCNM